MSQSYAAIRLQLLRQSRDLESLLPAEQPKKPTIRPMSRSEIRQKLLLAANVHSEVCIICGWGDGSLPRFAMNDPLLQTRRLMILLFQHERDSFASSLDSEITEIWQKSGAAIVLMRGEEDVQIFVNTHFLDHSAVTRIGGLDIVTGHPLDAAAEMDRSRLLPIIEQLLVDRPSMLGNDIGDTFTGLLHAAGNAPHLLAAPDVGDLDGCLGSTPVISIAAGPSLGRHIEALKILQHKAVLIACDAVLAGLLDKGIHPHFVTALERLEKTAVMVERAGECQAIFAGLPVVTPRGRSFFGDRLVCVLAGDQVYKWMQPDRPKRIYCGSSSGVLSVSLACLMTRGPVYLVGHDLSSETRQSHWSEAEFAGSGWAEVKTQAETDSTARWQGGFEERWIPGNAGTPVRSITWWNRFRDEIELLLHAAKQKGITVYNVNAHDKIAAVIQGTKAAPLPNAESLPDLVLPREILDARHLDRVQNWKARARLLGEDVKKIQAGFSALREEIAQKMLSSHESDWGLQDLAAQASLIEHVSPGNKMVFAYFLRSALTNLEVELQVRRRTPSRIQSRWAIMNSIDGFSHAVQNALTTLEPLLQRIADDNAE